MSRFTVKKIVILFLFIGSLAIFSFLLFFKLTHSNQRQVKIANQPQLLPKLCPTGYVLVPGSDLYHTSDFCVMKYDAKCAIKNDLTQGLQPDGSSLCAGRSKGVLNGTYANDGPGCSCVGDRQVVSTKSGFPITFIPESGGTDNAQNYCQSIGAHLITNAEWMTIARNVEQVTANWCDPNGTGCGNPPGASGKVLANGHFDNLGEKSASNGNIHGALIAADDDMPCFGTTTDGSNRCGGISSQKRTLTLSNGAVMWDFAGNVWQWVDIVVRRMDQPKSATKGKLDVGWTRSDFAPGSLPSVITDDGKGDLLGYDAFRPSNPSWNANNGVGRIYHYSGSNDTDTTLYTFIRGGNWRHGTDDGAFTVHMSPVPTKAHIDDVGFRCVTAPLN